MALIFESNAQIVVSLRIIRLKANVLSVIINRLCAPADVLETNRLLAMYEGLDQTSLILKEAGQIAVKQGTIRFKPYRLLIAFGRFVKFALFSEDNSQIIMSLGVLGFELECLSEASCRYFPASLRLKCTGQIVTNLSTVGRKLNCLLVFFDSFRRLRLWSTLAILL